MLKPEALAAILALCAPAVTVQAARPAPAHPKPRSPKAAPKAPIPLAIGDIVIIGGVQFTVGYGLRDVLPNLSANDVTHSAPRHPKAASQLALATFPCRVGTSNLCDSGFRQFGLPLVGAMRMPPLLRAVPVVVENRPQEKVGGIAATAVVTVVANKSAFGDSSKVNLPGDPMGAQDSPAIVEAGAYPKYAVAAAVAVARPDPTTVGFLDVLPVTISDGARCHSPGDPTGGRGKVIVHRKSSFPVSGGGSVPARLPNQFDTRKRKSLPGTAPIVLNLGDTISVNGSLFTISIGLVPVSGTPPPPPPPMPTLTGYSPNPVAGGQPFSLLGTSFVDPSATATWNGQPLGLILTSPTTLSTTAPGVTSAITAPVILTSSGTRLVGPNLTVTPSSGPAPDMTVFGFRNGNRDYSNVFAPGQTVIIVGKGFGALAGTVSINHKRVPVDAWSDTEIRTTVPALDTGQAPGPATLDIIRVDHGSFNSSVAFVILPPPGRFGNR